MIYSETMRCGEPAEYGPCCMSRGHTTPEHWCCPMHSKAGSSEPDGAETVGDVEYDSARDRWQPTNRPTAELVAAVEQKLVELEVER